MSGLGDRLKEARVAKGYTLEDLQSITKIQKRYLSGIENEDYSMMPGSFYVRAFIKQYSEAVELDAEEMLSLYRESTPKSELEEKESQLVQPMVNRRTMPRRNSQFAQLMPKITVALFIIVIIFVVYFLIKHNASTQAPINDVGEQQPITVQDGTQPDGETPEVSTDEKEPVDEEPVTEEVPEKLEQQLSHLEVNGQTSTYTLEGADRFTLEIRTTGDSWIGVLDGAQKERMTPNARGMKAGETVELDVSDTDEVRVRVGYSPEVAIYVNGELLEYVSELTTQTIVIKYMKE
ncbi:RodZ domain-containing protein [Sporosarcina sp. CAU 1771]